MDEQHIKWTPEALHAARIIDDLMVLFKLYDEDYAIVDEALRFVVTAAGEDGQPVSMRVRRVCEARGLRR